MNISNIGLSNQFKPKLNLRLREDIVMERKVSEAITVEEEKSWDSQLICTNTIDELSYPFEFLNPVQSEFYANRFLNQNFIISAATSAGKTVIAELSKNGKFLYLSPLKAISQEKRDDWTDEKHAWSKLKISISTGDYQLTSSRVQEMRDADVIVMTSEMLDSRSRNMESERNDWLKDIKTLVIDEFHLVGYGGRGDKLESALIRFTEFNKDCRIICLSATMPNVMDLAKWLTVLNGKKTKIMQSDYRPVKLTRMYETYFQSKDYQENENIKVQAMRSVIQKRGEDKIIAFVHTKNFGNKLMLSLAEFGIKAEFHNADLNKEDRIRIQKEFNSHDKGSLKVIVATSTLAWGVNTPADTVVIGGLHRGINLIDNQDIHQMCGRAGRIGKTAKGEGTAIILLPNKDTETYIAWCEEIKNINSKMNVSLQGGIETLCFHIISEVMNGYVTNEESLLKWYNRSLAYTQGVELTLEDAKLILDKLEQIKMIKKNDAGIFEATGLGRVSALLYYSPFDIFSWFRNFLHLFNNNYALNPVTLSWALGKVDSFDIGYIPPNARIEAEFWSSKAKKFELFASAESYACATYYHLLSGTDNFPLGLQIHKRQIQADYERANAALSLMDKIYSHWNKHDLWKTLVLQVKYGVKAELIGLVQLPQIGSKRAEKLYDAGIKNADDFVTKRSLARGVIGAKLYDKILQQIS